MLRRRLARAYTRLIGYRFVGSLPRQGILVGAPHTSNWDFLSMLLVMWHEGGSPRVLVKQESFRPPLGWLIRRLGAIPVDRDNAATVVSDMVRQASADAEFRLIIAAEGTRSQGEYWKSGFRRIAAQSGLPVTLGFLDRPTKTMGFGPTFHPSDDVVADMDLVREFYADKPGRRPGNATTPRLREEDQQLQSESSEPDPEGS